MCTINGETVTLGIRTATRIQLLSEHILDIDAKFQSLTASFQTELHAILDENDVVPISSSPLTPPSAQSVPSRRSSSLDDKRHPCPPYIASAYKWLRNNLHKPYPTIEELKSICTDSNTTEKRIKSWFTSARQRMGWTAIARDHFRPRQRGHRGCSLSCSHRARPQASHRT